MIKLRFVSLIFFVLLSMPLFSAGFGFFGTAGGGKTDMLKFRIDNDYRVTYSILNVNYGGGLIIESGSRESTGFANRFSFSLEGVSIYEGRYDYNRPFRFGITNTFAFGLGGSDIVRIWIGPQIGLNLITALQATNRDDVWEKERKDNFKLLYYINPATLGYIFYHLYMDRVWKRTIGAFIPVGISLGINIHISEAVAITLEAGFRCGFLYLTKGGFNYEGYMNAGFIFGVM